MRKEYTAFRCKECGTVFIIPDEYIDLEKNYLTCPNHGGHTEIQVCGAYDDLRECMSNSSYHRNNRGAIEQDG